MKELTPLQRDVMENKGTEPPFTGEYLNTKTKGIYICARCGNSLFSSDAKYDSGTGWPSFTAARGVLTQDDDSHGMVRTEVICSSCKAHLGHVFEDGLSKSGKRFCINSCALELNLA